MAIIVRRIYRCEKPHCTADATVVQSKYRGNADDRNGPLVLYRCDQHAEPGLPTERLERHP